jgi:acetyl-CoA C-acetyltransferase
MKLYRELKNEKKRVAVVGTGQTKFEARTPQKTYYELALEAATKAVNDAGISPGSIDSVVYGIYNDLFER